jgi:hypothetical protein
MNYYCTLFDSNYLARGLSLYDSLVTTNEDFLLYIIAFDYNAYRILAQMKLENLILIKLEDVENDDLMRVKGDRTKAEYCWTCTSSVIEYLIERYNLAEVTYLDADLYFFNKPSILLNEFEKSKGSVFITEHRFPPKHKMLKYGKYCVQFMTFKSNEEGLKVLNWWKDKCIGWCYARLDDGKFGDQKYLDNWTTMFPGIYVLQHLGGGVAPWNVIQYNITQGPCVNGIPIVFYHFHHLRWYASGKIDLGIYKIPDTAIKFIYELYFQNIEKQYEKIRTIEPVFEKGRDPYIKKWDSLRNIKRILLGEYNVIKR